MWWYMLITSVLKSRSCGRSQGQPGVQKDLAIHIVISHIYDYSCIYELYMCTHTHTYYISTLPSNMDLIIPLGTVQSSVQTVPQVLCTLHPCLPTGVLVPTGSESVSFLPHPDTCCMAPPSTESNSCYGHPSQTGKA